MGTYICFLGNFQQAMCFKPRGDDLDYVNSIATTEDAARNLLDRYEEPCVNVIKPMPESNPRRSIIVLLPLQLNKRNSKVGGALSVAIYGLFMGGSLVATLAGKLDWRARLVLATIGACGGYLFDRYVPVKMMRDIVFGESVDKAFLNGVTDRFYRQVREDAKKKEIPVLDLSEIEAPSKKDIKEGVAHIIRNHNYDGQSITYFKSAS